MHFFIDGYNLLFRLLQSGSDLKSQRQQIIQQLSNKASLLKLDLTLVFDSQYFGGESTRSHFNHLEIIFTSHGETADEFILESLKHAKNPSKECVVTSDKRLAWSCKRRLAQVQTVEEFVSWSNRQYKNRQKKISFKPLKSHLFFTDPPLLVEGKVAEVSAKESGSFEYYLDIFEKALTEQEWQNLERKNSKKKKLSSKRKWDAPLAEKTPTISNFQRWLEAFERIISRDDYS